jgi:hypothetical protein
MPLYPYPGGLLFPAEDLYPGPVFRYVFRPPTQERAFHLAGRGLFGTSSWGLSVWRIDGVWHQGFMPTADVVAAADRFYSGGGIHPLNASEASDLIAAGYGPYITNEETAS